MTYRPTGQLVGNIPLGGFEASPPNNASDVPSGVTAHPANAKFVSWGEGAEEEAFNRPLIALARNIDYLRSLLVKPIALPGYATTTDIAELQSSTGTTIVVEPDGSFDGWIYTGASTSDLANLLRLVDASDFPVLDAVNSPITVIDVETSGAVSMVGVQQTLASGVTVTQPAATSHPKHILKTNTASLSAQIGSATARGLLATVAGSTPTTASVGSNNGTYIVADGTGIGTEFVLAEYRYRLRMHTVSGAYTVSETVTGGTSGATGVVSAVGSSPADWLELSSVTGIFRAGETVTGGTSGRTGVVVRFTSPGDPVVFNNDVSAAGTVTFKTDGNWINGYFTSGPRLKLSSALAVTADRRLRYGKLGFLDTIPAGTLANNAGESGGGSLDKAYRYGRTIVPDLGPVRVVASGSDEAYQSMMELENDGTAVSALRMKLNALDAASENTSGLAVDTGTYNRAISNGSGMSAIEVRQALANTGVGVGLTNAGTYAYSSSRLAVTLSGTTLTSMIGSFVGSNTHRIFPSSSAGTFQVAEEVRSTAHGVDAVPMIVVAVGAGNSYLDVSGGSLNFDYADTLTGQTSGATAVVGAAVGYTYWQDTSGYLWHADMVVAEVYDADNVQLNGFYRAYVNSDTVVYLGRLGGGGWDTDLSVSPTTGSLSLRFWSRIVTQKYLSSNISKGALGVQAMGTGESGVVIDAAGTGLWVRRWATGSPRTTLVKVDDDQTPVFEVVLDDSASSDDADYVFFHRGQTDRIRSRTYRKASTGPTASIQFGDASGNIALRSANSGGTEVDVLRARKSSATGVAVDILGPAGTGLASGDSASFNVSTEYALLVIRSTDDISWLLTSATRGTLGGGNYTATDSYQYVAGNVSADGDKTGFMINNTRGHMLASEYVYSTLVTLGVVTGYFTMGDTITQAPSGATGAITHIGPGVLEVTPLAGTFNGSDSITGALSGASTVTAVMRGRSKFSVKKVYSGLATPFSGPNVFAIDRVGGFATPDANRQHPLVTVPDLAYSAAKVVAKDVPLSLIAQTGLGTCVMAGSPLGMHVSAAPFEFFVPLPPQAVGVTRAVVTLTSTAGVAVGDIVYNNTQSRYTGVVTAINGNQVHISTTLDWSTVTTNSVSGWNASQAGAAAWTTTVETTLSSVSGDTKAKLLAVEVVLKGALLVDFTDTFDLTLYRTDGATDTLLDIVTVGTNGTFGPISYVLIAPAAAFPTADFDESWYIRIRSVDAAWDATSFLRILKIRAFVYVMNPQPSV